MARYITIQERQAIRQARIQAQIARDKQRQAHNMIPRGDRDRRQSLIEVDRASLLEYAARLEAARRAQQAKENALQELRALDRRL